LTAGKRSQRTQTGQILVVLQRRLEHLAHRHGRLPIWQTGRLPLWLLDQDTRRTVPPAAAAAIEAPTLR